MKKYQNKEWLYNKYWKEMLSSYQIAKLIGISCTIIQYWLKKLNIQFRSHSESNHLSQVNHCKLSKKAIEFLNGELLGDGCLSSRSKYSARFVYGSAKEEYIKYIVKTLKSLRIEQVGKINPRYYKIMNCYTYHYSSRAYVELLPIRKKWYLNGKKIVPRDIKLIPITCRQWYIGDGSLNHRKNSKPYIILSTDGFPFSDVNWLVNQLRKLGFKATRQPSHNTIHISSYSTKDFLDYIGKCPVKDYEYKWAY